MRNDLRRDVPLKASRYNYPIQSFAEIDADTKEDALSLNVGVYAYNVSVKNGNLTNAFGISAPTIPDRDFPTPILNDAIVQGFLYYGSNASTGARDDRIITLYDSGIVRAIKIGDQYDRPTNMDFSVNNVFSNTKVCFANYFWNGQDWLFAYSDIGKSYRYNGSLLVPINNLPNLYEVCVHGERVFGATKGNNRLHFSAVGDPTNWTVSPTAGGYINFPDEGGKIIRLVSFQGHLYIFREFAIHRLTAYGDQTDFILTKVYSTHNYIFAKTVAAAGGRIMFLAEDGFYSFDGHNCAKVYKRILPLITDKKFASAAFFDNKYYVAAAMKKDNVTIFDEENDYKNNAVFCFDFDCDSVSILRGADVSDFVPINVDNVNELFCTLNNPSRAATFGMISKDGRYFDEVLPKKWVSPYTNLQNINKDKVLRRIHINTDNDLVVAARLDKPYKYFARGSKKTQSVTVNKRADKIGIELSPAAGDICVTGLMLEFDMIRRFSNE